MLGGGLGFGGGGGADKPWMRISTLTATSVTSGAAGVVLGWDTVDATGGGWAVPTVGGNPVSNTNLMTKIVTPFNGIVRFTFHDLDWQDQTTGHGLGRRGFKVVKNGVTGSTRVPILSAPTIVADAIQTVQTALVELAMAAGDYIEVVASQVSGSTLPNAAMADVFCEYLKMGLWTWGPSSSSN